MASSWRPPSGAGSAITAGDAFELRRRRTCQRFVLMAPENDDGWVLHHRVRRFGLQVEPRRMRVELRRVVVALLRMQALDDHGRVVARTTVGLLYPCRGQRATTRRIAAVEGAVIECSLTCNKSRGHRPRATVAWGAAATFTREPAAASVRCSLAAVLRDDRTLALHEQTAGPARSSVATGRSWPTSPNRTARGRARPSPAPSTPQRGHRHRPGRRSVRTPRRSGGRGTACGPATAPAAAAPRACERPRAGSPRRLGDAPDRGQCRGGHGQAKQKDRRQQQAGSRFHHGSSPVSIERAAEVGAWAGLSARVPWRVFKRL